MTIWKYVLVREAGRLMTPEELAYARGLAANADCGEPIPRRMLDHLVAVVMRDAKKRSKEAEGK